MIKSGEKKEEYRETKEYWKTRFENILANKKESTTTVTFSNGYSKNRDQFKIELSGIFLRRGRPEWGAEPGKQYFVLELGQITHKE